CRADLETEGAMRTSVRCRASLVSFVLLLITGGCVRGPAFHAAPVAPSARVGIERRPDSTRAFFDSLAAARAAERVRNDAVAPAVMQPNALADLAWIDIIND